MNNFSIVELIDEYEMKLQRYALGLTQDEDQSKDLVQETMLQAMTHLHQLQSLNPYQRQAWLYRVLKNRFIDHIRAAKREQAFYQRLADLTEPAFTPESFPGEENAVGTRHGTHPRKLPRCSAPALHPGDEKRRNQPGAWDPSRYRSFQDPPGHQMDSTTAQLDSSARES